jgi:hypothetical protein
MAGTSVPGTDVGAAAGTGPGRPNLWPDICSRCRILALGERVGRVPVANLCDVNANVLAEQNKAGRTTCEAQAVSTA